MFFVVVLSLAALASAGYPKYQLQQQGIEDVNPIPFSIQEDNSFPMTIGTFRNSRYFPYYGQIKENYPLLPYNKNFMTYPSRSNYFLRYLNKPETSVPQPKVDYDSQNMYHLHDVNHHHMINNIHSFKQREVVRKLNDVDSIPYSPVYNNKYMGMYKFYNKGNPQVNKYYSKSLEQDYVQPLTSKYYNRYWDSDYVRNYNNRNLDYPITTRNLGVEYVKPLVSRDMETEYVKPIISKNMDLEYATPINTRNLDLGYVQPAISKTLNVDYVKPTASKNWELDFVQPAITRNLDVESGKSVMYKTPIVEYVKPVIPKNLEFNYVQPAITKNLNLEYVQPVISKSLDVEYVKPIIPKNLGYDYIHPVIPKNLEYDYAQPAISKNLDLEYIKPVAAKSLNIGYVKPSVSEKLGIVWTPNSRNLDVGYTRQPLKNWGIDSMQSTTLQSEDIEFVPEVSGRNLEGTFIPNYYNWDLKQHIPIEGRFKRDLPTQVGTNVELQHQTPVPDLRHDVATPVEQTHQVPVVSGQHELAHEQIPQGVDVQRHDIQVNANHEPTPVPAEPVSEQPNQRQARDIPTQSLSTTPQYVYYPYYLDPYLPVQTTPLVVRSALYPNSYYYNLLYRK